MTAWKCIAAALVAWAMAACPAWVPAAIGVKLSQDGVDVWIPGEEFKAESHLAARTDWETIPPDKLPYETTRPPALGSANLVAAIDGGKGVVTVYTREGDRVTKRGEVSLDPSGRFAKYKLVRDAKQKRLGTEIYSAENRLLCWLYLTADGILEFRPGEAKGVSLSSVRLKYGIVPSLMGTDLVYSAQSGPHPEGTRPGSADSRRLNSPLSCLVPHPSSLVPQLVSPVDEPLRGPGGRRRRDDGRRLAATILRMVPGRWRAC